MNACLPRQAASAVATWKQMQRQGVSDRRRQHEAYDTSQSSRLQTAARLFFLPVYAAKALLQLPASVSFAEDAQNVPNSKKEAGSAFSLVIPRIAYCFQDLMLLWQALVINTIMGTVQFLAAEGTVSRLQGWLESAGNKVTGDPEGSLCFPLCAEKIFRRCFP